MKTVPFYKLVASGNDFVVIDNRKGIVKNPIPFARELCERHTGIGADGVLLMERSKKSDFGMRILNADGSEAEACGNGFRCVALLAHERLGFPKKQRFETVGGIIDAEVKGKRIRVRLATPTDLGEKEEILVGGRKLHYHFIRIGNPHVVIFVEGLSKVPVFEIGKEVRYHSKFQSAGTNVNFVEVKGSQAIEVRTYERGVEGETLACGTGSAASAIVSVHVGYVKQPVQVKTKSGETLALDFKKNGNQIQDVYLEGEASFVFEGKLER
ncbi:MAG: diaminopimelate epimerase [Candidatus Omnitrophica bacterium]|nr:diaminopimelate epimerase [Candidatus Omnitrophota bacterium]